ncbi:hypothetical protein ACFQ9V_00930 [Leifsonia sp. NPDC056665]|uniref:hypothetical protein n=1 Tax=Leifsonia sp. NPDC056665 TaxID=3345901 RepID=UPI003674F210
MDRDQSPNARSRVALQCYRFGAFDFVGGSRLLGVEAQAFELLEVVVPANADPNDSMILVSVPQHAGWPALIQNQVGAGEREPGGALAGVPRLDGHRAAAHLQAGNQFSIRAVREEHGALLPAVILASVNGWKVSRSSRGGLAALGVLVAVLHVLVFRHSSPRRGARCSARASVLFP